MTEIKCPKYPKCKSTEFSNADLEFFCISCGADWPDAELHHNAKKKADMNRFIYHYSGRYPVPGGTARIDGIVILEKRIDGLDSYLTFKKLINSDNADQMTITSISFLGMEN